MSLFIQFSSLSGSASVDQQTGNLSVFDILEEVRVPKLPITLPGVVLAFVLLNEKADAFYGKAMVHFMDPRQQQRLLGGGDFSVPEGQRRMKALFRFGGLQLDDFGTYRLIFSLVDMNGKKVEESVLEFDVIEHGMDPEALPN